MKNNIKKAPVKFWEDLVYFQHFMQIFVLAPNHHLNNFDSLFNCTPVGRTSDTIVGRVYCLVSELYTDIVKREIILKNKSATQSGFCCGLCSALWHMHGGISIYMCWFRFQY